MWNLNIFEFQTRLLFTRPKANTIKSRQIVEASDDEVLDSLFHTSEPLVTYRQPSRHTTLKQRRFNVYSTS